jgi:hypothetical protein
MADDFDRKAVMLIAVSWGPCVHTTSMSHLKNPNKLTYMDPPTLSRLSSGTTRFGTDAVIYPTSP